MVHYYQYQDKKFEYLRIESSTKLGFFSSPKNLLFLHGINDCVQNHLDILTELSEKGFTVYALNLPLHGHSDNLDNLSWDELSKLVLGFIKDENLTNLTIVGYSLGGAIVLKSLKQLANIDNIILISPYCHSVNYFSPSFMVNGAKFVFRNYYEQFVRQYNKPAPFIGDTFKIFKCYIPLFNENIEFDLEDFNKNINMIILGKDEMISAKQVERIFSKYQNIKISILDNFTHNLYYISSNQVKVLVNLLLS